MTQTTATIEGMMCSMCEAHINDVIRKTFTVKSVKSNHRKGQCVIVSDEPLDEARLQKAIDATGYTFCGARCEPYRKKGLFGLR